MLRGLFEIPFIGVNGTSGHDQTSAESRKILWTNVYSQILEEKLELKEDVWR